MIYLAGEHFCKGRHFQNWRYGPCHCHQGRSTRGLLPLVVKPWRCYWYLSVFYPFRFKDRNQRCACAPTLHCLCTWCLSQIDEGDCRYLPREVLQNDDELDLRKADVFSLGCSMYAVITSEELPRNGALWHEIRNGKLRYLPQGQKLVSAKLAAV